MSYLRDRAAMLLAAATLTLGTILAAAPATPASAAILPQQCDISNTCMNFWNGGFAVRTYQGTTHNNAISIQWLGNGKFELRDNIHGGCVGDYDGAQYNPAMGGGNICPSSGTGDWGTIFQEASDSLCPSPDYVDFWSGHWLAYVGFADGNNHPVSENTRGNCIRVN